MNLLFIPIAFDYKFLINCPKLVLLFLLLAKALGGTDWRLPETIRWPSKNTIDQITSELLVFKGHFLMNLDSNLHLSFTWASLNVILNELKAICLNYLSEDDCIIVILFITFVFMLA